MNIPVTTGRDPQAFRLLIDAVALSSPGWLPVGTGWEGLDDLAAEHRRLLAVRGEVGAERAALIRQYEDEDARTSAALRESFRPGGDNEMPEVTAAPERSAALRAVNERLAAANEVLDEFLNDTVAHIEAATPEWLGRLSEQREESALKRREAARLLREAEEDEMRLRVLRGWVERNGGIDPRPMFSKPSPMRFMGWDYMAANYRPPAESDTEDPNAPVLTQLEVVDNHDPRQFAVDLNRGNPAPIHTEEES